MFKFDEETPLVDAGVWTEFEGSKFLVAHISNMKFQRALAKLQQPYRQKIERGALDPATHKKIVAQAMAEGILLDWKEVGSVGGETPPYTSKNGLAALMNSVEFRDYVTEFSTNLSNFREEEVEELGKSSSVG